MSHPRRSRARTGALAALSVVATATAGASLLRPGTSSASSHREAPYVASDPAIDNTDVYAFVSPDKPSTATLIANWSPFQEPAGGPNFYPWATDAAYDINLDNNGDAKPDVTYRWTFTNVDARGTVNHGDKSDQTTNGKTIKGNGVGGSFLYNDGPVTSLTDSNLLFRQTYTLTELDYDSSGVATPKTLLADKPVVPSNVGSASMPSFASLRRMGVAAGAITGGGQSYVGQADDPFFLDLRVFDLLYGTKLNEVRHDTLSHYNVNTIALQLPKSALAGKGDATRNPVIGVWSTTSRSSTRTLAATGSAPATAESTGPAGSYDAQVSRLGNPLVNEVVVPAQLKDYFNRSRPDQDGALLGKVQNPELPYLVDSIYGVPNPNTLPGGATRNDLSEVFLTGISKKAAAGTDFSGIAQGSLSANLNSLDLNTDIASGGVVPAEYLRLNLGVAPTASPKRLGALAGDFAGFPNGRRLADDVLDEALQVTEGVLLSQRTGLGDGVNANDKPFLRSFPYIADPHSGSTVNPAARTSR
ncbi:MAG: hypothetical protein JWM22_1943 [Frankiales bacterium]|nr:hypothetical protein [Frankiales bacterium]